MNRKHLMGALLGVMLAGCAAEGDAQARRPLKDNDFVTGSRIPKKDKSGVSTMTPEQWEQSAERASLPIPPKQ